MKTYQIRSERQPNGIWGSPLNLVYVKHIPSNDLLFSAIIMALAEKLPKSRFSVDMMFDDWFALKVLDEPDFSYRLSFYYKNCYVDDNDILYFFESEQEIRNFKLKNISKNNI